MCETLNVFYLVIFRIRHYGKFSITRESIACSRQGRRVFGTKSLESKFVLLPRSTRKWPRFTGKPLHLGRVFVAWVTSVFCEIYGIITVISRSVALNSFIRKSINFFTKLILHNIWLLPYHWSDPHFCSIYLYQYRCSRYIYGEISWAEGLQWSTCQVRYVIGVAGWEEWLNYSSCEYSVLLVHNAIFIEILFLFLYFCISNVRLVPWYLGTAEAR